MDWKSEAQFLFTIWRDAMTDCRHLAYGNTTGLRWDDLAEEIQNAWIITAQQVHQRYASQPTITSEEEAPFEKTKKRKKDQEER